MDKYIGFLKDGKNQRKYLRWIAKLTAKSKKSLLGLLLLNTSVAVASVLVSLVNKSIVDKAGDQVVLRTLVIIMVGLQLFSIVGGVLESLLEATITEKYACQMRSSLFERFLRLPWISRTEYHSEELLSRITSDVEQITSGVSRLIISGGALIVRLILAFCLLWNYAPALAVALIIIAPIGAVAGKLISRGMNKIQKEYQQTEADYRIFLQERLSKATLVQLFGQEENSIRRLQEIQDKRLKLVRQKNKWKVIGTGVIGITFTGAHMIAFVVGALMVSDGAITFGVMTAFLSLVGQIQGPIYSLANQIPQIVGVLASAGRIIEVSELEEEQADPEEIRAFTDGNEGCAYLGILADSVTVGYKAEAVVQNVSFDIKPGQMVMMAGKSGAGKTTLLRAIMGFLPSSEGELSFYSENGIRKKCDVNTRKLISYVPQGNTLMFGTIADNLRMGKSDATADEMKEVLRIADALEFVESLPDGIDTQIGEKATGISEGQAQRISIARALLKKSAILILDEATSALDEKTEMKILDAIARSEHPTVLYVSHRRYLDKYADQVVEL
ncbi:MAG: ABC transporter ATP-binding protein [Lachnospiraceae bacterium]|nr:ABC transporter ATP-binding protein [Lachnospiraceae bacterium]